MSEALLQVSPGPVSADRSIISPRTSGIAALLKDSGGLGKEGSGHYARLCSQLGTGGGFQQSTRFSSPGGSAQPSAASEPAPQPEDARAVAYAEGFAAGLAQAQEQAAEDARIEAQARSKLELSFARLDHKLAEDLRHKLRDTVAALCEATIAPLALDQEMLMRRIERAVAMLGRADDERVIRLNPLDREFLSERFAADWNVTPDPTLERGMVLVESPNGGVEDGPAVWRRTIAEALQQC